MHSVFCQNCFKKCVFRIGGGSLQFDTVRFKIANFKKRSAKRLAFCIFIQKRSFLMWKQGAKLTLNLSILAVSAETTLKFHFIQRTSYPTSSWIFSPFQPVLRNSNWYIRFGLYAFNLILFCHYSFVCLYIYIFFLLLSF